MCIRDSYLRYAEETDISFIEWVETVYEPADVKERFMEQWSGNPITEILRRE